MSLKAGFAQVDITPPLGTHKIGWIKLIPAEQVLDPLYVRAAVLESDGVRLAVVQMDTLCAPASIVRELRRRLQRQLALAGEHVMIAATHNHAGPAVASLGDVQRDEAYVASLTEKAVACVRAAVAGLTEARVGMGSCFEFGVSHNRRVVMRDGTVKTHGSFRDPNALFVEGPIDPELGLIAFTRPDGQPLGALVNFACHPCHHGGETAISAGFPGVLAQRLAAWGCPTNLFLNGAFGNLHTANPALASDITKEQAGGALADDAIALWGRLEFRQSLRLAGASKVAQLPYRQAGEDEIAGKVRGAQRFVDPSSYDRHIPELLEEIRRQGTCPAEVQAFGLDEWALAAQPAELFVQLGLKIKQQTHPLHSLVVGNANGMVGYVPHAEAFARGGYETTFCPWSKLAPNAGDMLADAAVELVNGVGRL